MWLKLQHENKLEVITDMPTNLLSEPLLESHFWGSYSLDFSNNTCFVKTSFSGAIHSGWPFVQECYESYFWSHLVATSLPRTFHLNEWWNGCDNRFSYLLKGCCCKRGHDRLRTWFSPTDSGDNLIALNSQPCRSGADTHVVAYFWCISTDQGAFPKFTRVGRRVVYRKCDGWMDHCDYDSGFLPIAAITLTEGENINLLQFLTKNRLGVFSPSYENERGKISGQDAAFYGQIF